MFPARLADKTVGAAPHGRRGSSCLLAGVLAVLLLATPLAIAQAEQDAGEAPPIPQSGSGQALRITVLATTDVHGNLWPYDYLQGQAADRGLAKVSRYVRQVRARQPNTLLVDCGDTFQGTPLAYLYATQYSREPHPVVATMNAIGYDAMAVGNHEFNFGLTTLWRLKEQARFPLLAANIVSTYHDSLRDFEPYALRTIAGVRVAILGLVTPAVPYWDLPEHYLGYEFRDLVETAKRFVPKLRRKADLVILLVHAGLGRDPERGQPRPQLYPEENRVWAIAEQVPGIDAIFFGHSHRELAGKKVNGALLVQPKNWGQSVAEVEFVLSRASARAPWQVVEKQGRLVPMDDTIAGDPEILDLTRTAHERTERYLNTVVAELGEELDARTGRIEDHPLVELIQRAQLHYGQAEVSLATLFSTRPWLTAGPVTIRDVYQLYFYENELLTVEITGAQLKEALEYAARRFKTYPWPEGDSPFTDVPGYSYDMAEGVSYQIDLSRPPGERIVNLRFRGEPVAPERRLRLALNSYRWAGGGGYEMLRRAKVVHRAGKEVRELIIDYLLEHQQLDITVDHNWKVVPAEARQALRDWVASPPPRILVPAKN